MSITHIAGLDVEIGGRYLRQRCAWCGYLFHDYDLTRVATHIEEGATGEAANPKPSMWPVSELVEVSADGHHASVVETDALGQLPSNACARIELDMREQLTTDEGQR